MTERSIDLNADVGESFGRWRLGDDAGLLRVVTSANIACGFHAGDPATLVRTCRLAVEAGVAIGAHVSYRDLAGFGRRFLDVAAEDLDAEVRYQIGALDGIARSVGGRVAYVKPHGALYTAVVTHEGQAAALVRAIGSFGPEVAVLGLSGSALLGLAEAAGLPTVAEAFADRGYTPEGTLVPRDRPGASSPTPTPSSPGSFGWSPTASSRRSTAAMSPCRRGRSAFTGTPRAPSPSRRRCGRG